MYNHKTLKDLTMKDNFMFGAVMSIEENCYTFRSECQEDLSVELQDGSVTIFLSTAGKNSEDVPSELVKFLKFIASDLEGSKADFEDPYVEQLQNSVNKIKSDREMGERYMIFEEMLREERQEGLEAGRKEGQLKAKREDVIEFLRELGTVPESLIAQVESVEDFESLTALLKLAAKADSIDSFEKDAAQLFTEQ